MLPSSECRRVGGVNKKIINDFFFLSLLTEDIHIWEETGSR